MSFFLMSQGSLNPKIRFLGQKVCSVAPVQTHRHTDTKPITGDPFKFQEFFLQPIKERSDNDFHTTNLYYIRRYYERCGVLCTIYMHNIVHNINNKYTCTIH